MMRLRSLKHENISVFYFNYQFLIVYWWTAVSRLRFWPLESTPIQHRWADCYSLYSSWVKILMATRWYLALAIAEMIVAVSQASGKEFPFAFNFFPLALCSKRYTLADWGLKKKTEYNQGLGYFAAWKIQRLWQVLVVLRVHRQV